MTRHEVLTKNGVVPAANVPDADVEYLGVERPVDWTAAIQPTVQSAKGSNVNARVQPAVPTLSVIDNGDALSLDAIKHNRT